MSKNDDVALAAERELIDVIVSGRASDEDLSVTFSAIKKDDFLDPDCALAYEVASMAYSESGGEHSMSKGSLIDALAKIVSPRKVSVIDMMNHPPHHTIASGYDITTLSSVVKEFSYRRRLSYPTVDFNDDDKSQDMAIKLMDVVNKVSEEQISGGRVSVIGSQEDFLSTICEGETTSVMPLGFPDLDEILEGGLRPGQLVIIGARPSQGKSTLALNFAQNVAFGYGYKVMFFSLEMDEKEILPKLYAAEAGVEQTLIKKGKVPYGSDDYLKIMAASEKMKKLGGDIIFDTSSTNTVPAIAAAVKAEMIKKPVNLIIVDYLQLMEGSGELSRQESVSKISRSMKIMAQTLKIPIICLSQLNRNSISKNGEIRQPALTDLRESGSLEQDADIVLLIGSPDSEVDGEENDIEYKENISIPLIVAKQRGGKRGTIRLSPVLAYSKFGSVSNGESDKPDFAARNNQTTGEDRTFDDMEDFNDESEYGEPEGVGPFREEEIQW